MLKSAVIFVYFAMLLAWVEPKDIARSGCLLDDSSNQCGQFCLRPILDHITLHQKEWLGACGASNANETQGKLDQLKAGQGNMQEALSKVGSSLHSQIAAWAKVNPEDFRARLDRMKSQNTAHMEVLQAVKTSLQSSKLFIPQNFTKAGSRYFYVENNSKQNWFSAAHTCRRMGGHLASPRKEDVDALALFSADRKRYYWLGISNLADEGRYISLSNGHPASFLKWRPNEPNKKKSQHCVTWDVSGMDDDNCEKLYNFICQADEEN